MGISDEDAIMIVIDRNATWTKELAWLVAFLAELGHERAAIVTRQYLHSMVFSIDDEQETSMMVERQALRREEHAICIALSASPNRDLDSSIEIKRSVSHVFQSQSLSPAHTDDWINPH